MNATTVSPMVRLLVGWVCAGILGGCAPTKLPLGVDIGKISEKISAKNEPISAALVISEKVKNANSTLNVTCGGTYTVPVGIELTEGMMHGLSQVFDSVSLVDAKPSQSGEFDFVIEPALPELTVEGQKNCYIRGGLWIVFPVKLFYNPVDKFEAQTTLRVSVHDHQTRQRPQYQFNLRGLAHPRRGRRIESAAVAEIAAAVITRVAVE